MSVASNEELNSLKARLKELEKYIVDMKVIIKDAIKSEFEGRSFTPSQSEQQYGMYTALCIDTIDIWKQNRIRFYSPLFHNPKRPIKELPWAYPVSSMGGFDDCGLNWVPPAGSTVCIVFEAGNRATPYYLGTTWHRNRGPAGKPHNWGYNVEEYQKIWEGHRKGYLAGPNDESQVFPPWNTESYNGFDLSSIVDFANNPEAQKRITYPNIFGFKTPEKHMIKMVDGDPKCNRRWKRFEIMSSCGNWIMLKDDHLHYAGQWAHPGGAVVEGDVSCVEGQSEGSVLDDITLFKGLNPTGATGEEDAQTTDISFQEGEKKEVVSCEGQKSNSRIIGGQPNSRFRSSQVGANPYFKHENECRPYRGPGTPLNPTCDLPQTGVQVMSISGHTLVFDDSVDNPEGVPEWERSTKQFSFGCNNIYQGRTYLRSATGHSIELSDVEEVPLLRGENNFIRLLTAGGIMLELNDHTVSQKDCPGCPPNVAGDKRGVFIGSSAGHTFEMHDETNEYCGPCRTSGGYRPVPKSKKAYMRFRTGYGLEIMMADVNKQDKTVQQYIKIFCPQIDNKKRGPHFHLFQEAPDGPGTVYLRVGGNYAISTYDNKVEYIGDFEKNPSDKAEYISRHKVVYTKGQYLNITETSHMFYAKDQIYLLAGEDCALECACPGPYPCVGPVLVYDSCNGCVRLSDRIFGSTSQNAPPVTLNMVIGKCPPCGG